MTYPAASQPPRRDRLVLASCIGLACALAWAYLLHLHGEMASSATSAVSMAEMGMRMDARWSIADGVFTFIMWTVMMIGMMSPTVMPMLLLFAATSTHRAANRAGTTVPLFALGYITVWVGFSALATLAQWMLHQAALLSSTMSAASPRVAGAVLIAAGAYQLTPLKRACLEHCQSPLDFLMMHWRDGASGAFHMGLRHGLYCLGCCWALMGVLFAVGVMSLVWVGVLTAFILLERIGRGGIVISRVGGVLLVGLGVLSIVGWQSS